MGGKVPVSGNSSVSAGRGLFIVGHPGPRWLVLTVDETLGISGGSKLFHLMTWEIFTLSHCRIVTEMLRNG